MAPLSGVAPFNNVQTAAIDVVLQNDMQMHGGEDCVLERMRGRFLLFNARSGVGGTPASVTGGFVVKCVIALTEVVDDTTSLLSPTPFVDSQGLGRDNILWQRDVLVSGTTILGSGSSVAGEFDTLNDYWFEIDVKAKRRIQENQTIILWFQTVIGALTPNLDFRMVGGLRTLLKRPR